MDPKLIRLLLRRPQNRTPQIFQNSHLPIEHPYRPPSSPTPQQGSYPQRLCSGQDWSLSDPMELTGPYSGSPGFLRSGLGCRWKSLLKQPKKYTQHRTEQSASEGSTLLQIDIDYPLYTIQGLFMSFHVDLREGIWFQIFVPNSKGQHRIPFFGIRAARSRVACWRCACEPTGGGPWASGSGCNYDLNALEET